MLISFSVKNYRSFGEKQILLMTQTSTKSKLNTPFFSETGNSAASAASHVMAIFGANAAGKSNITKSMKFFKYFVADCAKESGANDEIGIEPYLFDPELRDQTSEFEVRFIHGEGLYQYGFIVDKERVHKEWLTFKSNKQNSKTIQLLRREYSADKKAYDWKINPTYITGPKEVWKDLTRENSLFLSHAAQLNSKEKSKNLWEPFEWIEKRFQILKNNRIPKPLTAVFCLIDEDTKTKVLEFIQSVDLHIKGIVIEKDNKASGEIVEDFKDFLEKIQIDSQENKQNSSIRGDLFPVRIISIYEDSRGNPVFLDFNEESDGTQILFGLAGLIFSVLEIGGTLVIDELHNHIHPRALSHIIEIFNSDLNKNGAQLIFTSHEASVMDMMDTDQILFVENHKHQGSKLIRLSDYDTKRITQIQKAYLNGRFGGVPHIKEIE